MPRRRPALAALALAALVVAGCGGDGDDGGSSTTVLPGPITTGTVPREVAVEPSPGCRGDAPEPGRTAETVVSGGTDRGFALHVPDGLDHATPVPLALVVPSTGPVDEAGTVEEGLVAEGAVVVVPEPVAGDEPPTWALGDDTSDADLAFLSSVLIEARAAACIDLSRTLVVGEGFGAALASRMACEHANDVTVLVAVGGLDDPPECMPLRPVPVLAVHASADPVLPFEGGAGALGLGPGSTEAVAPFTDRRGPVRETAAAWVTRNDCGRDGTQDTEVEGASRSRWTGCDQGASVSFLTVGDAGAEIDVAGLAWAALEEHAPR